MRSNLQNWASSFVSPYPLSCQADLNAEVESSTCSAGEKADQQDQQIQDLQQSLSVKTTDHKEALQDLSASHQQAIQLESNIERLNRQLQVRFFPSSNPELHPVNRVSTSHPEG